MNERRGALDVTHIAAAAAMSWATMMSLAFIGALTAEAYLGHHPLSEFAVLFVPIMTAPFAFVLAAVYLPTLLIARHMVRGGHRWMLGAIGGAAAPLAGLALLAGGRVLFAGSPHMRPAMWDDVVALARDPVHTLPYALALLVGGIVLGTMMGRERQHLLLLLALAGLLSTACRPTSISEGRYIVTAEALNIGIGSGRFCIATDPADPHGAWWWEPGPKGCSSRSTGPAVFHAENAAVSPSTHAGATDIRFRVPLHTAPNSFRPPFVDVWLVLDADAGHMRAPATGAQVATIRRSDLDVPEAWR